MASYLYSNCGIDTVNNWIYTSNVNGQVIIPIDPSDGFDFWMSILPSPSYNITHYVGDIYSNAITGTPGNSNNAFVSSVSSASSNFNLTINNNLVASCNCSFRPTGCNTFYIRKRPTYVSAIFNNSNMWNYTFSNISPLISDGDQRITFNGVLDNLQTTGVDAPLCPTDMSYSPVLIGTLTCSNIINPQLNATSNQAYSNLSNFNAYSNIQTALSVFNSNTAVYCSNSTIPSYVSNSNFSISSNTLSNSIIVNAINCIPQNWQTSLDYMTPGMDLYKNTGPGCLSFGSNPINYNPQTRNYQAGFSIIAKYYTAGGSGTVFDYSRSNFWHNTLLTSNNTCRFQSYNSNVLAIDASIPVNLGVNVTVGLLYSSSNFQMWASDGSNTSSNLMTTSNNLQNGIVNDSELYGGLTGSIYTVNFYSNVIPPYLFSQFVGLTAAMRTTYITNNIGNPGVVYLNSTKASRYIESNLSHVSIGSNLAVTQNAIVSGNMTCSNVLSNLGQAYFSSNVTLSNPTASALQLYGSNGAQTSIYAFTDGKSYIQTTNDLVINKSGGTIGNTYLYGQASTNYVGVNTQTPQFQFDVNGNVRTGSNLQVQSTVVSSYPTVSLSNTLNNNGSITVNSNAGCLTWVDDGAGSTNFSIQSRNGFSPPLVSRLYVASTGYVGINTQSPKYNLDVNGTIQFGVNDNAGMGHNQMGFFKKAGFANALAMASDSWMSFGMTSQTQFNGGPLSNQPGSTWSEYMRLTNTGQLGINTVSPSYPLDIAGNTQIRNNLYLIGNYSGSNTLSNIGNGYFGSNLAVNQNITIGNSSSNFGSSYQAGGIQSGQINTTIGMIETRYGGADRYGIAQGNNGQTRVYASGVYAAATSGLSLTNASNAFNDVFIVGQTSGFGTNIFAINYGNYSNFGQAYFASNVNVGGNLVSSITTLNSNVAYYASNALANYQTSSAGTVNSSNVIALNITASNSLSNLGQSYFGSNLLVNGILTTQNSNSGTFGNFRMNNSSSNETSMTWNNATTGWVAGINSYNAFSSNFVIANTTLNSGLMYFTPGGKVGILNNNPQSTLDVNGRANISGNASCGSISIPYGSSIYATNYSISNMISCGFNGGDTVNISPPGNNGFSNPTLTVLASFQGYQRVGIATPYPNYTLDVNGTGNISGNLNTNTITSYASNTANGMIQTAYPGGAPDRYGISQLPGGAMRQFASGYYGGSTTGLSFLQSSGTGITDALYCGQSAAYGTTYTVNNGNFSNLGTFTVSSNTANLNINSSNVSQLGLTSSNSQTAIYAFNDGKSYIQAQNDLVINKTGGTTGNTYLYGKASTGYVGINTQSPGYNLDVNGNANIGTTLRVGGIATTGGLGVGYGGVALYVNGYSVSNVIASGYTGAGDTLNFMVPGNNGNQNPTLSLTNAGAARVGVNNANPQYTLDVNGTINCTSINTSSSGAAQNSNAITSSWIPVTLSNAAGGVANPSGFDKLSYRVSPGDPDRVFFNGWLTINSPASAYNGVAYIADSTLWPKQNKQITGGGIYQSAGGAGFSTWTLQTNGVMILYQQITSSQNSTAQTTFGLNGASYSRFAPS